MIAAIRGFIPALDRRLSITIKSGAAAKVVPNPATKPKISDRCNLGTNKLFVSRGTRSWQLHKNIRLKTMTANITLLNRSMRTPQPLTIGDL
jgi:hypothetical protein